MTSREQPIPYTCLGWHGADRTAKVGVAGICLSLFDLSLTSSNSAVCVCITGCCKRVGKALLCLSGAGGGVVGMRVEGSSEQTD